MKTRETTADQPVMTPKQFAAEMRKIFRGDDKEAAHVQADDLMTGVLRSLGYGAGADVFKTADKYYA